MTDREFLEAMRIAPADIPEPIPANWQRFENNRAMQNMRKSYEAHIQGLRLMLRGERDAHENRVNAILGEYVREMRGHNQTLWAWRISAFTGWACALGLLYWICRAA